MGRGREGATVPDRELQMPHRELPAAGRELPISDQESPMSDRELNATGRRRINVLYVGFFTQRGAMADDYIQIGSYLAGKVNLYCLMGESDRKYDIPNAAGILRMPVSRRRKISLLDVSIYREIREYARANSIDVVFYKTPHPMNAVLSFLLRDIAQAEYCHDYKDHSGVNPFVAFVSEISRRVMAANTARTFVASQSLKEAMLTHRRYWKEDKISVVPLGIMDDLVPEEKNCAEDIDVLFFGRIERYKGLGILAEAVAHEPWNVFAVGKGSLGEAAGIEEFPPNVTFINRYVDDKELSGMISRCRIIVMPYLDGTGSQIIPTAMYCGKTVIATDVGSFGEYIQNGIDGILIPPGDAGALKKAISDILGNESLRAWICGNAAEKARRQYTNSRIADLYLREMEELLGICENDNA